MSKYFAYGSCINKESFEDTLNGIEYKIVGIGKLENYKLAFLKYGVTRGGGVLDIVEDAGNYVLGLVYEVPEEAFTEIDIREGAPKHYKNKKVKVKIDGTEHEVNTYEVVTKKPAEIKPTEEYKNEIITGMEYYKFPADYIENFRDHCNSIIR